MDANDTRPAPITRFLICAPALLAGLLALRAWALWLEWPAAPILVNPAELLGSALWVDAVVFARSLPLLCLLSWPLLRLRSGRGRYVAVALLWSAWLLVAVALEQYFISARVPLGADLFGYSWQEITTTADGGLRGDVAALTGWWLPLLVLWLALAGLMRFRPSFMPRLSVAVLVACIALWLLPLPSPLRASEDVQNVMRNKTAYFIGDSLRYFSGAPVGTGTAPIATVAASTAPADPDYPFLHPDQTPDALGPYFNRASAQPPHLVFIVVEGLGRTFSGPDAARGSFTPFLDELAGQSLYWDNFLATQGRTFGVLPSVFGSLPFGEKGFAALGARMPPHAGLLNVLKRQGYALRFYAGSDVTFDNERVYLQQQGMERIVDIHNFESSYRRNPYSSWGYDDGELVARVLADGPVAAATRQPTITVIQTMSMHTSYRFAGQDAYRRRVEQRLEALGIAEADRAGYRAFSDIYSTVLFTDDALRRYFEAARKAPGYENTVFVITGDHRLPEIPMDTKIERYHVPLIVFSPLLRQPERFRAVSSHLDITPSLLAFLAHGYGLQRPAQATWTGIGLDTGQEFRSTHDIPLKHAKTILADFVAGPWFVSHEQLYRLEDGMRIAPVEDAAVKQQVLERFARYQQANRNFAQRLRLSPEGATPQLVAYVEPAAVSRPATEASAAHPTSTPHALYAHDIDAPVGADTDLMAVGASFTNATTIRSAPFVPLLVLSDEGGRELRESYAAPLQLAAGASGVASFQVKLDGLPSGRYFIAVLPSHPDTGRRIGEGLYRIPVKVRCCAPGGGALARP
ncbi:LTA synthase family protein [Lysobacter tyrosinilyticus]